LQLIIIRRQALIQIKTEEGRKEGRKEEEEEKKKKKGRLKGMMMVVVMMVMMFFIVVYQLPQSQGKSFHRTRKVKVSCTRQRKERYTGFGWGRAWVWELGGKRPC
jgi:cell division septal protein FtsQ